MACLLFYELDALYIVKLGLFSASNIHIFSVSLSLNFFAQKLKTGSCKMKCPVRPYVLRLQGATHSCCLNWKLFIP